MTHKIAEKVIRQAESVLSILYDRPVCLQLDILRKVFSSSEIISLITATTGFSLQELQEYNKITKLAAARHLLSYYLNQRANLKPWQVGKIIKRDRTSAITSIQKAKSLLEVGDEMMVEWSIEIENQLTINEIKTNTQPVNGSVQRV